MKKLIFTVTNDLTYDRRMIRICTSLSKTHQVLLVGRRTQTSKTIVEQSFQHKRLCLFFQKGKLFYLEYQFRLFLFLLFQSFDAVCAVDLDTILPCLFISRLKSKPCFYDAHEYFTETPEVIGRPAVQEIWESIARFTIPKMYRRYTVSDGLADIFNKRYGVQFDVIRNVPTSGRPLIESNDRWPQPPGTNDLEEKMILNEIKGKGFFPASVKIILYQGALNEGRGIEFAIEAMRDLNGASLWIAGEGDLSVYLRDLAGDLEKQGKVRFLGYLQPDELWETTEKAYIGLNLLENKGLSYYYSLANKFFDYIHAGKPQITMHFPEYIYINDQYEVALLLEKLNTEVLIKALSELLIDENLYHRLKSNCREAAQIYNWENEEKILTRLYNNIPG